MASAVDAATLGRIHDVIDAATLSQVSWQACLREIGELTECADVLFGRWVSSHPMRSLSAIANSSRPDRFFSSAPDVDRFAQLSELSVHYRNPIVEHFVANPRMDLVFSEDEIALLSRPLLRDFQNEFRRPWGFGRTLNAALTEPRLNRAGFGERYSLNFVYPLDRGAPAPGDRELFLRVRSRLATTIRLWLNQDEHATDLFTVGTGLSDAEAPIVLLSADLRIEYLNAQARALLDERSPSWNQLLFLGDPNLREGLEALRTERAPLQVRSLDGAPLLPGVVVDAHTLAASTMTWAGSARFVLVLRTQQPSGRVRLAMRYQLTPRETDLAELMWEGFGLSAAADALGMSINTAKTHARALYSKLGVNKRAAAVRAMSSFLGDQPER